jgi:beta-galactosidase
MTVHVYTSGDSVKLTLNGREVATNTVALSDKRMTTFSVPYSPGTLTATASLKGAVIGTKTLTTAGSPAAIRLTPDVASLTTSRDDLAHVLVEIVDAHGKRVPDAVTQVEFAVSGAGSLAGVGNGNPHNVDSFKQPRRYTWHGQALAVLRPAKTSGSLTLTARAAGLTPATVMLHVDAVAASHPHGGAGHNHRRPHKKRHHPVRAARALGGAPALVLGLGALVLRRRMGRPSR